MATTPAHASSPLVLAIDAGTTGVTAIVFDLELRPVSRAYAEFPQSFPSPGRVEHRAEDILSAVDDTVGRALEGAGGAPVAVGITNQRETLFALSAATGRALAPGIVWQDRRTAARCAELREAGHSAEVAARTGLVIDPYFSATKAEWLIANDEGVRAAADAGDLRFLTVDGLIVHHLTRGERWVTDPTNASRTMLFDIGARSYAPSLLELFGVEEACLPEVVPSGGAFGEAHLLGAAGTVPIHGVLGDQQAALFGQGCFEPGAMKTTYGTGCFLLLNTGARRVDSSAGLLTTLAVDGRGEPCFALEGSAFAGGTVVQWLRDELGIIDDAAASEELARSVPDTGGVVLVPAFAGLGAPHWDPGARAALLGLTRGSSRAHIARAALEAIAHQCADLVEALREDSGESVARMLVDGGAARNDLLMQRQADFAALRVVRPGEVEATARGAAAIAAVGAGLIDAPGLSRVLAAESRVFEPDANGVGVERTRWRDAIARVRSGPSSAS